MGETFRSRFRSERACGSARELISLALDGEITGREAVLLRAHLAGCSDCAAYKRQLVSVAAALRESAPELTQGAAIRQVSRRTAKPDRFAVLAGAAALALIGFAALAGTGNEPAPVGALSAAQGMPVYGGLSPEQGYPAYIYKQPQLPRLD
jgi:predicted anti-sigma-YlaC factor YlaD